MFSVRQGTQRMWLGDNRESTSSFTAFTGFSFAHSGTLSPIVSKIASDLVLKIFWYSL